jgi:hypothetical protein
MVEFVFSPLNSQVFVISQIIITVVALFLTGLAVKAWKNTRLKKMIFLIIAFALFAISHIIDYVDQSLVDLMPDDARYAMFAVVDIAIMMMFVFAILKK